ncbi:TRAP transporter substrate-binding protein [Vannielia litorea]|uniref:TRAP-type C4-dicarboxylate transport system, substrate-binding protein n=1 Tax=Vannielia litorea TaxID=1217970 RepID=A0A1N6GI74_9RHOB|nr:TRAP transporter substrate-binding protein [Vannielia litorea]SIO07161.1 TRAP-type C4-dicarboxylate transport system, substrate-binding protein [Vannielia litorea]
MTFARLTSALALAAGLAASAVPLSAEELSVATFVPPQHHSNTVMFKWFGEELEKRSGGDLTIKVYPAGQLGAGPVQQYKRAVEGVADITFGVSAYTPALFPKTMLAILPGKAESSHEATERMLAVFDEHLADEYEDVKVIALTTAAGIGIAATRDVSTMEGMQGAKIVPYAALTTPIVEAMGAVPVQMPVTEMYTGLSTGTIDGAYSTYNNMTPPWNFWDVASHFVTNVPVQHAVIFVVMNRERYEGLSDEHRAIIDELAGEAASHKLAESFDGADAASLEMMKAATDKSFEVIEVSAEERARMDAAVAEGLKAVFVDYASRGIDNAEAIYNAINQ